MPTDLGVSSVTASSSDSASVWVVFGSGARPGTILVRLLSSSLTEEEPLSLGGRSVKLIDPSA